MSDDHSLGTEDVGHGTDGRADDPADGLADPCVKGGPWESTVVKTGEAADVVAGIAS